MILTTNTVNLNISRYIIIVILIALSSELSFSQVDSLPDPLISKLGKSLSAEERLNILRSDTTSYSEANRDEVLQYAMYTLVELENKDNRPAVAEINSIIGSLLESDDKYEEAIEKYITAYDIYSDIGDDQGTADLCFALADVYKKKGFYERSMGKCLEGMSIYETLNDTSGLSNIYNCMGSLYKYQSDFKKSIEFYGKSLELSMAINDPDGIALSYNNIGVVHSIDNKNDLALDYYSRALAIREKMSSSEKNQGTILNNMGNIYLEKGDYSKAYELFQKGLNLHSGINYKRGIATGYRSFGRYYLMTGDYNLSLKNYLTAYDKYIELGRLEYLKNITLEMSEAFNQAGDNKSAYEYLKKNQLYSDSLFNLEKIKNIALLEMEYNKMQKDKEHKLYDQKVKIILYASFIIIILLLVIFTLLYSRQKIKIGKQKLIIQNTSLEKKQIEYELEIKQKEIAANTINLVKRNEIVNDVISRLSESISNIKEENIPLIKDIINELKKNTNPDIWNDFEIRFLQVHKDFYENLMQKYPDLSNNEKRLSAFLRLDFSTKEISEITNQTPHSINIARTRLRKKLGLANTDLNLSQFLSNF